MAAASLNIAIEQGATFSRTLVLKDSLGARMNLTGYTFRGQLRPSYQSSTFYDFELNILDAENGELSWGLDAEALVDARFTCGETWVYDIEMILGAVVTRLIQGKATISKEATK